MLILYTLYGTLEPFYNFQITDDEIKEMINIVDKNGDGKISYSEFRVMLGAFPLLIPDN